MKKNLLMLFVFLVLVVFVGVDSNAEEYYWCGDTKWKISPSTTEITIQFDTLEVQRTTMGPQFIHQCLNNAQEPQYLGRGFYTYQLSGECSYQTAISALLEQAVVERVLPVYSVSGGTQKLYVTDLVTVQFDPDLSAAGIDDILGGYGLAFSDSSLFKHNLWECELADTMPSIPLALGDSLHERYDTEWACASFIRKMALFGDPTDDWFTEQYYFKNTGQGGGTVGVDIDADSAWIVPLQDSSLKVAIIDDGVTEHYELPWARIEYGFDAAGYYWLDRQFDFDPSPGDSQGHGMACTGILCGAHDGVGIVGLNGSAHVVPVKIADDFGELTGNEWAIAEAIRFAANSGAKVLSSSWGAYDSVSTPNIWAAIREASRADPSRRNHACVLVFASGNWADSTDPCIENPWFEFKDVVFPANMKEVIAVGAMNRNGIKRSYSCYGKALDVTVPSGGMCYQSGDVYTIDQEGDLGFNPTRSGAYGDLSFTSYTKLFGGTSAACPQVAGIASLILARRPDLDSVLVPNCGLGQKRDTTCTDSVHVVNWIITRSAVPRPIPGDSSRYNEVYGWGRASAYRAMLSIIRGDVNNDAVIDALDINVLADILFFGGHATLDDRTADVNCDLVPDALDMNYLIDVIFFGGPPPPICFDY